MIKCELQQLKCFLVINIDRLHYYVVFTKLAYGVFRIINASIFKSADSVPKNLFNFHVPSDLFTSEDSLRSIVFLYG